MAILVNKEEKRKRIAFACKDILLEHGIHNITIAQIAETAGVGKGTVYEYFENKEDIVFEIITVYIVAYEKRLMDVVHAEIHSKEKFSQFFSMIHEEKDGEKQLMVYREFLAISMTHATPEMVEFNLKCRKLFMDMLGQIIDIGVRKNELPPEMHSMKSALLTFSLGVVIETCTVGLDAKNEIQTLLNALFALMDLKDKK